MSHRPVHFDLGADPRHATKTSASTIGMPIKVRKEPYLITGPFEEPVQVLSACPELPTLDTIHRAGLTTRNYQPLLQLVRDHTGTLRGRTAVVALTLLDGSCDGPALMTLRGPNVPSQPLVWGVLTGRFEKPHAHQNKPDLLTLAIGKRRLAGRPTPQSHSFDLLSSDAWHSFPDSAHFKKILAADDVIQEARTMSDLSEAEVLGALVVAPMIRKLGFGPALQTGNVKMTYAAEALRLGIAFNNITTNGNEFELLAMLSIIVVMHTGAKYIQQDPILTPEIAWGTQADVMRSIETGDLRYAMPNARSEDILKVCTRGECVRNSHHALFRLAEIRKYQPDLLRALTTEQI